MARVILEGFKGKEKRGRDEKREKVREKREKDEEVGERGERRKKKGRRIRFWNMAGLKGKNREFCETVKEWEVIVLTQTWID